MSKSVLLTIVGVILLSAVLVLSSMQSQTSLMLTPAELASRNSTQPLLRLRVAGRVLEPVTYEISPQALLKFRLDNPGGGGYANLPVVYRGLRPDLFAPGRDIIIDGELRDGVLFAASLLTQCPSKYEAANAGSSQEAEASSNG